MSSDGEYHVAMCVTFYKFTWDMGSQIRWRETTCGYVAFCLTSAVNFSLKLQMGTSFTESFKYGSVEKPRVYYLTSLNGIVHKYIDNY